MNNLEEQLISYYYGEADDPAEVERLLANDAEARQLYEELSAILAEVNPPDPPERDANYPEQVWNRIHWRLEPQLRYRWWDFLTMRQIGPAAALAAIILGAFFIGRFASESTVPTATETAADARQQILLLAVSEHLDRSQRVLVELLNAPTDGAVDVSTEQSQLADLVTDNRLYRAAAQQTGDRMIVEVLEELERVLLELRHGPQQMSPGDVQSLRTVLERQGTLFKMRVVSTRIEESRQNSLHSPEIQSF